MDRSDRTALALALAGDRGLTPVQLQKAVFLLQELVPAQADRYCFTPHNYGPFCGEVYDDARNLQANGVVSISERGASGYPEYRITADGQESVSARSADGLNQEEVAHARRIVEWVQRQSFRGLVSAIYERWPEYRVKSVFRG